jgi:hypothetical protein
MRHAYLPPAVLLWASLAVSEESKPCSPGFEYSISTDAVSPGQSVRMYGNWGPAQLDRSPDLLIGGEMHGGRQRLEVLEWTESRVQVRVRSKVRPGSYSLAVFCGERLQFVSPYKALTVLQPNPSFDYSLSRGSVRAGESLELIGSWKLRMDRIPLLVYDRDRERIELEVLEWQDVVVVVRVPVLVNGAELVPGDPIRAEIFVDSKDVYLMAGYRDVEVLPPSPDALVDARIDGGLAAPWISGSPRNAAIAAASVFLLGAAILGLGGMLAATADLALASVFLIVWVWPYTFGRLVYRELALLFFLEFLVIHSSAFLGCLSTIQTRTRNKIGIVAGCCAFYTLSVLGYSYVHDTMWPLVFFWTLMATKFIPLFTSYARDWDRAVLVARAAVGTMAYLAAMILGAFLPIPRFGWPEGLSLGEGIIEAEPYRLMFAGMLYFTLMGFYESWLANHTKEPVAGTEGQRHPALR